MVASRVATKAEAVQALAKVEVEPQGKAKAEEAKADSFNDDAKAVEKVEVANLNAEYKSLPRMTVPNGNTVKAHGWTNTAMRSQMKKQIGSGSGNEKMARSAS